MEFLVKLSNWVQKRRLDGLLEIPLNNVTISRDWKIATRFPIYKRDFDRQFQTIDQYV